MYELTAEPLTVQLLGEFELRLGDCRLPPLESARAEALLAYLLLHRDAPQPRQRLASLLWPESSEAQSRTNLRHLLHTLRRALPQADRFLEIAPRTLRWRPDLPVRVDVAVFEAALEGAGEQTLRDAIEIYGGDLLEGHYDEWILEERERLRERYLDALSRLASMLADRGDAGEAIRWSERLVASDPLREEAHRLLMRLLDGRGERARALRAYHACCEVLERRLGTEPSAETRSIYEELVRSGRQGPAQSAAEARSFVGRIGERARSFEIWTASERGRAQLLVLTGEAGVGKTRLLHELCSWCERRGVATAEARSYPAEGALAYAPVVSWLRAEPVTARVSRLEDGQRAELARLLPELGSTAPVALPMAEQRRRLFDVLADAIAAPGPPLLLLADDAHWADAESLQFLHYLIAHRPSARLLVAATARSEELDEGHPLRELMVGLRVRGRCSELELGSLSRHETRVLAERLEGRRLGRDAADELYRRTEGNPLFVLEALRAGTSGERVQAVIEARLARLSEPARNLAGLAATVGREFSIDVVAHAGDAGEDELLAALDELWRRRIVRERGSDAYDFTHDRIREVAYLGMSPVRRGRLHLRVAGALERVHADDLDAISGQLAAHYERGGDLEAAVRWYRRAAAVAVSRHAEADAVRQLDRAAALVRMQPVGESRDQRELALVLASLAPVATAEGYGSAHLAQLQRRGLELAAGLGVEPEPPLLRSAAVSALAASDFDRARTFALQLRALAQRSADGVHLVEGEYVLGISAFWNGRIGAAREHFEAAIEHYDPERRTIHLVRYGLDPRVVCMSRLGNTLWFLGHSADAVRARDTALQLAAEVDQPATGSTARWFAIMLDLELRDWDALQRHAVDLAGRGDELEVKPIRANMQALTGFTMVLEGSASRGLARLRRVVDALAGEEHAPGHRACIVRVLLEACRVADDADGGIAATELLLGGGAGSPLWRAEALRMRAEFRAMLGAPRAEIAAVLDEALAVARRQRARALEARVDGSRGTLLERPRVHARGP